MRGIRVAGRLLAIVVILTLGAYFTAHYVQYRALDPQYEDNTAVTFWEYFDFMTRSFTFESTGDIGRDSGEPEPLGALGYGVRCLEIAGFTLGGIIPLLWLGSLAYCDQCQVYMKGRALCSIPAWTTEEPKHFTCKETKAVMADWGILAAEKADETLKKLTQSIIENDAAAASAIVLPLRAETKQAEGCLKFIQVKLNSCPQCRTGHVIASLTEGTGDKRKITTWDPVPASGEFVRKLEQLGEQTLA